MPTYQYACTEPSCAHRFELVQSFTDPAASECPVCESPVRKVYGSVGVVFKGSGFYRTDSRNAGKSNGTKSDGAKSQSKSETKSESSSGSSTKSESTSSGSTSASGSSSAAAPAAAAS